MQKKTFANTTKPVICSCNRRLKPIRSRRSPSVTEVTRQKARAKASVFDAQPRSVHDDTLRPVVTQLVSPRSSRTARHRELANRCDNSAVLLFIPQQFFLPSFGFAALLLFVDFRPRWTTRQLNSNCPGKKSISAGFTTLEKKRFLRVYSSLNEKKERKKNRKTICTDKKTT